MAEVMTDLNSALKMIDPNNPAHAQLFMSGMSVLYPSPKERLQALTALRPADGYRSWLAFFYSNLKSSEPESAAEGMAELKALAESNAALGLRKQSYALLGARTRAGGDSEGAINWWKEGLKLDSADAELNNNIAYCLAEDLNKTQEGLVFAEKAARARPENGSIQDTLGWIYFKLGEMEKAEQALVKSMSYASSVEEQVPVLIHLAKLKLKQGKKEEAGAFARRAQELIRTDNQLTSQYEGELASLLAEIG
jgi:Flp pilus assembly protein TadD